MLVLVATFFGHFLKILKVNIAQILSLVLILVDVSVSLLSVAESFYVD